MLTKPRLCLLDVSWRRIAGKIPDIRRCCGAADAQARRFVEAVLWLWRTGAPWRDLPAYFGKWGTVYKRFRRWALGGAWQALHARLAQSVAGRARTVSIDSSSIRVHQHATGGPGGARQSAIGNSRGGRTSKLHAVVSSDKALLALVLTCGQRADIAYAAPLVKKLLRLVKPRQLIADRAYDSDPFISWLAANEIQAVIPPRRHRKTQRPWSKKAYRQRNVVERFYLHAKQFRRVATRFDKTPASYAAGVLLVSARYLAA